MNIRSMIMAWALIGASTAAYGASNGWTSMGPNGGAVNKIVYNKATPSTVYAIAAGGFFRSLDGGVSWQLVYSNFFNAPEDVEIDPSDSSRVYVVTPSAPFLLVSTDGGATLSPVTGLPPGIVNAWQIAVGHSGTTLYLSAAANILYSSDRGATWKQRTPVSTYAFAQVYTLKIDPSDSNTLYAIASTSSTDAGILATHDGGVTWALQKSGPQSTSLPKDLAVNAANTNQIWSVGYDGAWFSADKGATWTNLFSLDALSAMAIDPSNPSIVYAGTPSGAVFRSGDAGATWIQEGTNISAGQISTLAVNPSQGSQLLVGGFGGVSGSSTSGSQWTEQTAGLISTAISGLSADLSADRIYLSLSSGGVYYAAAGAASTTPVNNTDTGGLLQVAGSDTAASILAQPGRLSVSLGSALAQSADGGTTWSLAQVNSSGSNQLFSMTSSPASPQTIMAVNSSSVPYRSADGGLTWGPSTTGLPANSSVGMIAAAASDPTIFYASVYGQPAGGTGAVTYHGAYKSTDAGLSWSPANTGITTTGVGQISVDPSNAKIAYAATLSSLIKTTDGGASWSTLISAAPGGDVPYFTAIDPRHPNIIYGSGVTSVARSVDGGASWQYLRAIGTLPTWSPLALLVDPNRPENIVVGTNGFGAQQFTVAPDLSLTVAAPSSPVAVGATATYNYTVLNAGPFDATGVQVTMQLPSTATNIAASASGGTCAVAASVATCTFAVGRVGVGNAITLTAVAPSTGSFQVSATATADQPDPKPANNSVASTDSIENLADLGVTVTGTATAQVGDSVSYTVTVKNLGPNAAAATQLNFQLASGLTAGSVTSTGGSCSTSSAGLVSCSVGSLAMAQSVSATISATASAAGTQSSTASVSSGTKDLVASNNSAKSSTTVTAVPAAGGGGGGGGGSLSWSILLLLALTWIETRRRLPAPR